MTTTLSIGAKTVAGQGVSPAPERATVSIVVPCYNSSETVEDCVQSLVSQDYKPVEIVMVDDGSTDGTPDKLRDLKSAYPEIKIVETTHSGPSHARNVGTAQSIGDWVLFADADAKYSPHYLDKALSTVPSNSKIGGVCVTGSIWIKKSTFVSRGIALEYEMKQRFLNSGKWGPYFAFLYRREALDTVGGFDEALFQSEDKDLFERIKAAGYQIGLVVGFNWFHLYPQDVSSLITRSYRAGKQRVIYIFKKKSYGELFKRTVGLWALAILIVASLVFPLALLGTGMLLVALYCLKAIQSLVNGRGKGRLIDVMLLPLVSAFRYLSGAAGYTKGSAVYFARRIRGLHTSWSDV